jgi:hypothetical protein
MSRRALLALALLAGATSLPAQDIELTVAPPRDSVVQHARDLVLDGNHADARKLLDSVIAANVPEGALWAEALYWRGALAQTAADAERDYRLLLIEAPLAPRAEDALLQLAQLQHARGDRKSASEQLHRYLLTYPNDESRPARPKIALWLVRLLFDQNLVTQGCGALRIGRDAMQDESLELRNQLEFYAPRCDYVDVAAAQQGVVAESTKVAADTVAKKGASSAPTRSTAKPFYSVQVAAYDSQEAAQRMAAGLVSRGLEARVDGTTRPFRVRIGKYASRADAVKMAQTLKRQGQNGFVAQVTP